MNTLGVSNRERFISRVSFYLLLVGVLWTTNQLLPVPGEWERQQERALGVVQPMIGVSADEAAAILANLPVSR
ncbi:MAG: hypothetical protein MI807_24410 [Verrucomicrobiales bacterium]|nr:hypothetical protein [Verrucomicrobiales bacterium]